MNQLKQQGISMTTATHAANAAASQAATAAAQAAGALASANTSTTVMQTLMSHILLFDHSVSHCVACETRRVAPASARFHSAKAPGPGKAVVMSSSMPLSSLLKAKEYEWSCVECYVKNKSHVVKCAGCETTKPGFKPQRVDATKGEDQATPLSSFTFGSQGGSSFGGDNSRGSQTTASAGCFTLGFESDNPFLLTPSAGNVGAPQEPTGSFKFPISTGSFTFGPPVKTAFDVGKENTAPGFGFVKSSTQGAGILCTLNAATSSAPVFGGGIQGTPASVFGFAKPSASVFGAGVQQSTPIKSSTPVFGSAILETPTATKPSVPVFGSGVQGTPTAAKATDDGKIKAGFVKPASSGFPAAIATASAATPINVTSSTPIVSKPLFDMSSTQASLTSSTPVFGSGASFSFSSIAASSTPLSAKDLSTKFPANNKSLFENAGQPVFGSGKSPRVKKVGDDEGEDEGAEGEYEAMANFVPIVSLPEVKVRTGEEGEDKLFGERARLYRMDGGQWKVCTT